ncbi:MAG: hypothetical protein KU29_09600 [Sulfurovum sp. FS06-10]|nr:MAG: hypothetical protein KU29_09600 [Sulfurovum sp. FS06-10]
MSNLTKEQAEAYFQEFGAKCPFCGSYELNVDDDTEYDTDYAWRKIECNNCKAAWTDEYRLTTVIQKFEDGKENEFENSELIKELAKPATPNYYNLAWNHARRNGLELVSTISKYSVCKKSENEWCVHTITDTCLEYGHYGFDSAGKAGYYALMKILFAVSMDIASELQKRVATTWRNVIRMVLMKLKEASLADIYAEVEKVAGDMIARNANWQAKVRQQLQLHFTNVQRGVWAVC